MGSIRSSRRCTFVFLQILRMTFQTVKWVNEHLDRCIDDNMDCAAPGRDGNGDTTTCNCNENKCPAGKNGCTCAGDGACGRVHVTSSDGCACQFKNRWLHHGVSGQSAKGGRRRVWCYKCPARGKDACGPCGGRVKNRVAAANRSAKIGLLWKIKNVEDVKRHMETKDAKPSAKLTAIHCKKVGTNQAVHRHHYHIIPLDAVEHDPTKRKPVLPARPNHGGDGIAKTHEVADNGAPGTVLVKCRSCLTCGPCRVGDAAHCTNVRPECGKFRLATLRLSVAGGGGAGRSSRQGDSSPRR